VLSIVVISDISKFFFGLNATFRLEKIKIKARYVQDTVKVATYGGDKSDEPSNEVFNAEDPPPTSGIDYPFRELFDLIGIFKVGFSAPELVPDDIKHFQKTLFCRGDVLLGFEIGRD